MGSITTYLKVGYPSSARLIKFASDYPDMAEDAVLNWDRVVHKNVRTSDRSDVGNIIQIAGDSIRIMQGANRQYQVPKSHVEGFDGSEVYLDIPYSEIAKYKAT